MIVVEAHEADFQLLYGCTEMKVQKRCALQCARTAKSAIVMHGSETTIAKNLRSLRPW